MLLSQAQGFSQIYVFTQNQGGIYPTLFKLKEIYGISHMTDLVNEIIERYINDCQDDLQAYDAESNDAYGKTTEPYDIEPVKQFDFFEHTEKSMDLFITALSTAKRMNTRTNQRRYRYYIRCTDCGKPVPMRRC